MAARTATQNGNWSSSSTWGGSAPPGNGDTADLSTFQVTVDTNTTVGTSPAGGGTAAIVIGTAGKLIVAAGITLICRGPVTQGNGSAEFAAGSVFEFDASQATTPLSQKYAWTSSAFVRGNRKITVNGTSGSHVTIRSNASGGNGYFYTTSGFSDSMWFDGTGYADFQRVGDSTNSAIVFNPQSDTFTNTFLHCTFDADCGAVEWVGTPPAGGGWDIEDCQFNQVNAKTLGTGLKSPLVLKAGTGTITGTRKIYRSTFAKGPALVGRTLDCQDCYFGEAWSSGGHSAPWTTFSGNLVRLTYQPTTNANGGMTGCFCLFDAGGSPVVTGTSSGSNSTTTLNDTGKSWTVNAYQPAGSVAFYLVEITGGTGVGQRRGIKSNTATQLTVTYRWDTTPDATSTYAIYADIPNNHGVAPDPAIPSGTLTFSGNVFQNAGCDTQGDCLLHLDNTSVAHVVDNNIVLPNAFGDSSGTLLTCGTAATNIKVRHNTAFTGAQVGISLSEGGVGGAGQVDELYSNIFWCDPNRTPSVPNQTSDLTKYFANGGAYGPYNAVDTNNPSNPSLGTTDLVVAGAADYNCSYGGLAGQTKSYQFKYTTTPGAHDLYATDPQFVDSTRSFWKWAVSQGSTATTITGQVADGLAYIKADPTLTRLSLIPYIQAGFAPTNSLLENAGQDGVTIGAVAGVFTPPSSGDENNMTLASTTNTAITASAWTKIADATDVVYVQAQQNSIYLRAAASSPSETDGFILQPVNFANRPEDTGGTPSVTYTLSAGINLYARGVSGAAIVSVMKD